MAARAKDHFEHCFHRIRGPNDFHEFIKDAQLLNRSYLVREGRWFPPKPVVFPIHNV